MASLSFFVSFEQLLLNLLLGFLVLLRTLALLAMVRFILKMHQAVAVFRQRFEVNQLSSSPGKDVIISQGVSARVGLALAGGRVLAPVLRQRRTPLQAGADHRPPDAKADLPISEQATQSLWQIKTNYSTETES